VLDAWLAYGSYDADSRISILDGSYDFERWFGSVNLTGQYVYEDFRALQENVWVRLACESRWEPGRYGVLRI